MVHLRRKVRHADTKDMRVVGSVVPRRRPRRLALIPEEKAGRACPHHSTRLWPPGSVSS
ncbi:hypothetical protein ACFWRV_20265 [Streptomyces sp. NPDC058576]|uniref:hypothetical protein n=1 Tax=Streptomyces sp. NPDC058576 TaxID=3346547 RepID=UPI003653ECF4